MIKNGKIIYQAKKILECLPEEEYKLIPRTTIEFIEKNYEYDENFSIDFDKPLEEQQIADETFDFLDKIMIEIEQ